MTLFLSRAARLLTIASSLLLGLACIPRAAAADDTLTIINGASPAAFYLVLQHTAQYAGFFKEEHLTIESQYTNGAGPAAQLVASGKGDLSAMSVEPAILGYEKGLRLVFFFDYDPRFNWVLGVLDDSPIRTLADFKGTTIGEISPGSAVEPILATQLAGAGVSRSDYTIVPIGVGTQALTAIVNKQVAGAAFPSVELAMEGVQGNVKFRYFRFPLFSDVGNTGYFASQAAVATKGPLLARFARAIAKASILIRENPRLAARYFCEGAGIKLTDQAVDDMTRKLALTQGDLPGVDPTSRRIGQINRNGLTLYAKFLADNGITRAPAPITALTTDQFIPFANDFDHQAMIARAKAMR
jgi:NitT/TauT family transport system substrate-binding protein